MTDPLTLPEWATYTLPSPAGRKILRAYYEEVKAVRKRNLVVRRFIPYPDRPTLPAWTEEERHLTRMSRRDLNRILSKMMSERYSAISLGYGDLSGQTAAEIVRTVARVRQELLRRHNLGLAMYRMIAPFDCPGLYHYWWRDVRQVYVGSSDPERIVADMQVFAAGWEARRRLFGKRTE